MEQDQSSQFLLPFRRDLKIFSGPEAHDGSPTYTIFDPLREEYFKASWPIVTIMKTAKEGMTVEQLNKALKEKTTLKLTDQEVLAFYHQAQEQGLLAVPKSSEHVAKEADKEKVGWLQQLLLNYLFFRVPLFDPDQFLTRTYPKVAFLASSKALYTYMFLILWGLSILALHGELFITTFTYFFNLEGFISYILALSAMKVVHELSHAYVAKKYGLRVPSMGVALLVLFPVLYTDVTDAWRLADKRKRMAITGAGIMAEMVVAAVALIFWAFLSPGILQSLCFVIASANLIHTLAINLNPAMRFDGYYLLSDLIGVENLQGRAFTFLRRVCYRIFLGIRLPWPDSSITPRVGFILTSYAFYTLIYRIFLYTAIALFVYHEFTKVLGVILFLLEIALFFVWPVVYEISLLLKITHLVSWNRRAKISLGVIALFVFWAVVPLPHQHSFSAVTVPFQDQQIYAPHAGRLMEFKVKRGDQVTADQILAVIETPNLTSKLASLEQEKKILEKKLAIINQKEEFQPFYLEKVAELGRVSAEAAGVQEQIKQNVIRAAQPGILYMWDPYLRQGQWVAEDQVLGHSASMQKGEVIAYLPERYVEDVSVGEKVIFRQRNNGESVDGVIKEISPIRSLSLGQAQLASVFGGDLPTRDVGKNLILLESYFAVKVELKDGEHLPFGQVGVMSVRGRWTTAVGDFMRWCIAVFYREGEL